MNLNCIVCARLFDATNYHPMANTVCPMCCAEMRFRRECPVSELRAPHILDTLLHRMGFRR